MDNFALFKNAWNIKFEKKWKYQSWFIIAVLQMYWSINPLITQIINNVLSKEFDESKQPYHIRELVQIFLLINDYGPKQSKSKLIWVDEFRKALSKHKPDDFW